jgi:hypothetical protein
MKFVDLTTLDGEGVSVAPEHVVAVVASMPGYDTSKGGCIVILTDMRFVVRETRAAVIDKLEA